MNARQWFLSALIVYHLFAAALTPMLMPPFGDRLGGWVTPYVARLELTNLWEFFAPNPAVPASVPWEGEDASGTLVAQGTWPRAPGPAALGEVSVRSLAALYFMVGSDERLERMLAPHLCASDPRLASVRLWREQRPVTPLAAAAGGAASAPAAERRLAAHVFCAQRTRRGGP